MKWLIGLDLRPSSDGALAFARWLAETSSETSRADELVGLHVIERERLTPVFRHRSVEEVTSRVESEIAQSLEEVGAAELLSAREMALDPRAAAALSKEAVSRKVDGVIVGRRKAADNRAVVRLGRTAHRLVRRLSSPVVVVPPDLSPKQIGTGPILVATDFDPGAVGAMRFARALAQGHGRDVIACYVAPEPEDSMAPFVSDAVLASLRDEHRARAPKDMDDWASEYGLKYDGLEVVFGTPAEALADLAVEKRAAALVVGSRHLSGLEVVFVGSVGLDLAASGPCPVAVVPPDYVPSSVG